MLGGLITRILAGRAPTPAEQLEHMRRYKLKHDLEMALVARAKERLARPARTETRRFAHARPKVDQLVRELACEPVPF